MLTLEECVELVNNHQYKKAINSLRELSKTEKDKEKLGKIYAKLGICESDNNLNKSIALWKKGSALDNGECDYLLAEYYKDMVILDNTFISKDHHRKKAFAHFKKSADLDYLPALKDVADCYRIGYGTTKNEVLAKEYLEKFEKGIKIAKEGLVFMPLLQKNEDSEQLVYLGNLAKEQGANEMAYLFYKKADSKDYPAAAYKLSICFGKGIGVEVNEYMGNQYLEKAAKLGYEIAMVQLAMNHIFENNISKAEKLIIPVLHSKDIEMAKMALFSLGTIYFINENDMSYADVYNLSQQAFESEDLSIAQQIINMYDVGQFKNTKIKNEIQSNWKTIVNSKEEN